MDIHHGTIEVASEGVGKGATFRVRLPLTDKRPSESRTRTRARACKSVRVLVVEDDPDARALIARILDGRRRAGERRAAMPKPR